MQDNNFDVINPDGVYYVDIKNLIKVFSSTEYDSLEKAASEIIDNAIDANAKNILVFLRSSYDAKKGKNVLSEISFLDDGEGMSPGLLQHVVGFGSSSRVSSGKIGKFGIGMNQASLFACKKFDVYSWVNENDIYLETFDSEYIIKNNIEKAEPPIKTALPKYVSDSMVYKVNARKHGTLIVWSKFKENKMAKPVTIAKRMKNEFGRVYRNYLNSGELRIYTEANFLDTIHAIDPMFLLENTDVLGDPNGHSIKCSEGEPLFELFSHDMLEYGCKAYDVPYYDNGLIKYSRVILRASIIKEKFYYKAAFKDNIKQPGDTEIGAYLKEFQKGITVIRNNREIDFNYFGFYDSTNQPQDRWFKLEIIFTAELDDAFHVSNNKQHVELKKITDSKLPDFKEEDPNYPMWLRLKKDIDKLLSAMRNRNRAIASKAKSDQSNAGSNSVIADAKAQHVEESLDDILDSLNGTNSSNISNETIKADEEMINQQINDFPVNIQKSISVESRSLENGNLDRNDSINKKYYHENQIIVAYETKLKEWITFEYDFNLKKYVICFNLDLINKDRFDSNVEYLIVLLCVTICDESSESTIRKKFIKLLNKYSEYICGGN
ncbi:MAG: ATP-binding protein [Ureaplasma sp.]|nr:ATP-binding protein [Ureaplasma sp.]